MAVDPGQSVAAMTASGNERLAATHALAMARDRYRRAGAGRVPVARVVPRSAADAALLPVRVLLLHRPERRQPGAADGACPHRRCLGLVHPRAAAGRRARIAADGDRADPDPGLPAHLVYMGAAGRADARPRAAPAGLVSRDRVFRDPQRG